MTSSNLTDWIGLDCAVFSSPPTQYRLYGRRFLQVKDPTNSIKVLKEDTKDNKNNRKYIIHVEIQNSTR